MPAAKKGDTIKALDHHIVLVPSASGTTPVDETLPFNGILGGGLCASVLVEGLDSAVVGSTAKNTPPHVPIGGKFANEPTNEGRIVSGSSSVTFGGKPAARAGDRALTCNDPVPLVAGVVGASSSVLVGG